MFKGREIIIGTMHQKEMVIAPLLSESLGVRCKTITNLNTDVFGTFTGEIERAKNVLETVREKCLKAIQLQNCDLGIASEGSFGQHPVYYFMPANEETLIFIDQKNDLEITASQLFTETNFQSKEIHNESELNSFVNNALFPSHALILRSKQKNNTEIYKGITNYQDLLSTYRLLSTKYKSVLVETDMRAMYNPTRMKNIKTLTEKLIKKIQSLCPNCKTPGFDITDHKIGLPCEQCGFPTKSVLTSIYCCAKCKYTFEKKHPRGIKFEDPRFCDICNP